VDLVRAGLHRKTFFKNVILTMIDTCLADRLAGEAAEMWCLDSIALSIGNLSPDQSFWIILEYHSEEPRSSESSADSGASIIGQLIDVFSRKNQRQSRADRCGRPVSTL